MLTSSDTVALRTFFAESDRPALRAARRAREEAASRLAHPRNGLLAALPRDEMRRLGPSLEHVALRRGQVLQERNVPLTHAYFIESGSASLTARAGSGARALEVGTLGRRDATGIPILLGTARSPHRCVVQTPGSALRIGVDALRRIVEERPSIRHALLGYVQFVMVQGAQIAACSAHHALGERLAGWLLVASDRTDEGEIALTHRALGKALGVRRAGITAAMGRLEEAGVLRRGRGRVTLLDRAGLEAVACSCYRTLRAEQVRLVGAGPDDVPRPAARPVAHVGADSQDSDAAALHRALAEGEARLRDLHHRVKNSLQMIASLLHLEARDAGPGDAARRLMDAQRRILTLARLNERLSASTSAPDGLLDAKDELEALCADLATSTGADARRVTIAVDAPSYPMRVDRLTPLALLVSEAVTNAVKHASPEPGLDPVTVTVTLALDPASERVRLVVEDDGAGFRSGGRPASGLGRRLLAAFARQLEGSLVEDAGARGGARLTVAFPLEAPR